MPLALQHLLPPHADAAGFGESLLRDRLPAYLERQRWYTSKGRPIAALDVTPLPSWSAREGFWLARIRFADADADADAAEELRVLALAEVGPERAFAPDDPRVVATTPTGATLVDAVGEEGFRARVYELMAREGSLAEGGAVLRGTAGRTCREHPAYAGSRVPPQNSSNTVVAYEPGGFFKLFRKTEPGVHPDAELLAYLSEGRGFASVPPFGGALSYRPGGGDEAAEVTIGLLLGRVDHRGEAWETMLHDVAAYARAFRDDADLRGLTIGDDLAAPLRPEHLPPGLSRALGGDTVRRLRLLGERTAEMHLHFAAGRGAGMEPVDLDDGYWAAAKTALVARLREEERYAGGEAAGHLARIADWLERTRLPRVAGGCTRVHGDYHLGQVLDTADDVVIIDFEGEPLHSLAYRRRRHPPFKDVAGMVRSLHYAPYAHALQETDGAAWAMRAARTWYAVAARLFLTAYLERAGAAAAFVPRDPAERDALLAFFLADKALYELAYERASRPAWVAIPRAGVAGVAAMLE